jgi:hypothetical protein
MGDDKQSHVLSIRLAADLLASLRQQAKVDGRSLSGEVVSIVKERLAGLGSQTARPFKITGSLEHLDVPGSHVEFRTARAAASARLLRGRTKARSVT